MDRNRMRTVIIAEAPLVASREGGVDRNTIAKPIGPESHGSPPARGAWIATGGRGLSAFSEWPSPPARGAWIATCHARHLR